MYSRIAGTGSYLPKKILTNEDLEKIRCIGHFEDSFDTRTIDITYASERGAEGMPEMLDRRANAFPLPSSPRSNSKSKIASSRDYSSASNSDLKAQQPGMS